MARNQRGRGLDLATRNHLSALDAFIEQQAEVNKPIQPDEFTINSYIKKMKDQGIVIGNSVASRNIKTLIDAGRVTARKAIKDGKQCNIYRFI
jgi:hypothetical protein